MKIFKTIAVTVCAVAIMSMSVNAYEPVNIEVTQDVYNVKANGTYLTSDNYFYNNNLYVPVRDIFESLGSEVNWNDETRTITVKDGNSLSEAYKGEYIQNQPKKADIEAYQNTVKLNINNQEIEADNFIFNGKTYIDATAISKVISHFFVDNTTRTVRFYSPAFADGDTYALSGNEKISEKDFWDIADFVYQGSVEYALQDNFASLDDYFMHSSSVVNLAQDYGIDFSQKAISDFFTSADTAQTIAERIENYTDTAKENIIRYYYAYSSINEKDLSELYNLTDEELLEYYKNFKYSSSLTMKAQHILIGKGENNEGLEKINELLKKAKEKDTDFTQLMLDNSQDPGSQSQPDGYIFTKGEMVDEFYNAALKTPVGEISDVFESSYGYHILKKVAQWDNGMPIEEIKDELLKSYSTQKLDEEFFDKLVEADVYYDTPKATETLFSKITTKE